MTQKKTYPQNLVSAAVLCALFVAPSSHAALNDIVIIKGTSSDSPMAQALGPGGSQEIDIERVCRVTNTLLGQMGYAAASSGISNYLFGDDAEMGDLANIPQLDCDRANPTEGRYVLMFSTCSMHMTDGINTMRWTVPPDVPEAQMVIADAQSGEFITGALLEGHGSGDEESMLDPRLANVQTFAKGREISQTVNRKDGSKRYEIHLEIGPTGNYRRSTETFVGQEYSYDYEGDMGLPGVQEAGMIFGKMISNGTAWLSPEVPGSDVVARFYENFKTHVVPATESGTLFTAMIEQMADVVEKGIPLETTQTVTTQMGGGPLGAFGLGSGHTSTSKVRSITVWQGAAAEHQVCGHVEAPEGFTETSLEQMMSGANMSPEDAQEINEAMQEYQQAMQSMSEEERQMLQQMGMGDMLSGMMGTSGMGAPQSNGAAPGGAETGSSAATGSGGSNMPPSEELQGDSMTESVQRHLQALGYDVGETNGDASMETTIAISTFQAEKGMEVTGEVTPQLLGILSAEVDSRR